MASTIKVDNIQDSGGNSYLSSDGSGTFTSNVGITSAEQHYQTANVSISSADTWTLLTPFTRSSGSGLGNIETYVSSSSGIFSFSQTVYYYIEFNVYLKRTNHLVQYAGTSIWMTTDDSSYTELSEAYTNLQDTSNAYGNTSNKVIVDITDTSQCKVKFMAQSSDAGGLDMQGSSSLPMKNYATFIRLGNT
jgi:hypothetical protein